MEENRKTGTTLVSQGRRCQGVFPPSSPARLRVCGEPGALATSSCPSISHTVQCRYLPYCIKEEPTSHRREGEGEREKKRKKGKKRKESTGKPLGSYPTLTWGKSSCLLRIGHSTVQYVTRFMRHSASQSHLALWFKGEKKRKEKKDRKTSS